MDILRFWRKRSILECRIETFSLRFFLNLLFIGFLLLFTVGSFGSVL